MYFVKNTVDRESPPGKVRQMSQVHRSKQTRLDFVLSITISSIPKVAPKSKSSAKPRSKKINILSNLMEQKKIGN